MEIKDENIMKAFLYLAKTMFENDTDNVEMNIKNKGASFKFEVILTEIKLPENDKQDKETPTQHEDKGE